jgi:hypothetical protein
MSDQQLGDPYSNQPAIIGISINNTHEIEIMMMLLFSTPLKKSKVFVEKNGKKLQKFMPKTSLQCNEPAILSSRSSSLFTALIRSTQGILFILQKLGKMMLKVLVVIWIALFDQESDGGATILDSDDEAHPAHDSK